MPTSEANSGSGGSGSTSAGSSVSISGSASAGIDDTAGTALTMGAACAPWGESCAAMPCCEAELECAQSSLLCLQPGDDGINFLDGHYDYGGGAFECDLYEQDCPRTEKCMPWANDGGSIWNATRCSPVPAEAGQVGDDCVVEGSAVYGIDDCDLGLMCWNVDAGTLTGTCVEMCQGSVARPLCEDPDTACAISNDGALALCLPSCHPLLQDCSAGQSCYAIGAGFVCGPDASGDLGDHGDPCAFINACSPGNLCLSTEAHTSCASRGGCCSSLCDLSEVDPDDDCAAFDAGQSCLAWFVEGQAPMGLEDVGICAVSDDAIAPSAFTAQL